MKIHRVGTTHRGNERAGVMTIEGTDGH